MRFITTLCAILFTLSAPAVNLLTNGDFNGKDMYADFVYKSTHGQLKLTDFTEDMTWNKCLKVELVKLRELKDGTKLLTSDLIFGKKGYAVDADAIYNFNFDFKGNMQVSIFVNCYNAQPGKPEVKLLQTVRPTPRAAMPEKANWSNVKGSFKVPAGTKYITFTLRFWASSAIQRKFTTQAGDMVLLDNIKLEKKVTLDSNSDTPAAAPAIKRKEVYTSSDKVEKVLGYIFYPWLKNPAKLPAELAWQLKGNTMYMTLQISDEQKAAAQAVKTNGKGIWKDHVAEVFFTTGDGMIYQFACSAAGGRFRSVNGKEDGKYQQWKAYGERKNGKIVYKFELPLAMFTENGAIAAGELIKFNVGFKYNNVNYTLSPVKTGFSDVANFSFMLIGSTKDFQQKNADALRKDAPKKVLSDIERFASEKFKNISDAVYAFEILQSKVRSAKMGSAPFVVATMPLVADYSYPLEISPENLVTKPIKLQAAGNETAMLPLVIGNRTNSAAAYRVVIHNNAKNFFKFEDPTLDKNFPAANITLREAVPVKDSENKSPAQLLDALPKMNEAQTITIPAKSSGLVWIEFNTANVPAGTYNGSIRVIPLAEPAEHTRLKYSGAIQDHPISLEVLPFKLGEADNSWLCAFVGTDDQLKYMRQLGGHGRSCNAQKYFAQR